MRLERSWIRYESAESKLVVKKIRDTSEWLVFSDELKVNDL